MSDHRKITAIIRMKQLQEVERRLLQSGVKGITVTVVKGFGEWHTESYFGYTKAIDRLVGHVRIEIFVEADQVDALVDIIAQSAFTGDPGDGIIATLPIEQFIHIRPYCKHLHPDTANAPKAERTDP